jgi:hypothetical protein
MTFAESREISCRSIKKQNSRLQLFGTPLGRYWGVVEG